MTSHPMFPLAGMVAVTAVSACHAAAPTEPPRGPAPSATPPAPGAIRRSLIARRPATGLAGWETRLYLIEYPPGASAPPHTHPAVGVGLVLDGRFESAFGDEPTVQVEAGQGFVDQADTPHRVFRNLSPDHPLRFVIAYTLRAQDEPLHVLP
ncbi:MAG TPA: cupin domain-containing protein [Kofleriaceae bacterium]|nr:cupin domain-containing protein [Kofleriaceae bacterium]